MDLNFKKNKKVKVFEKPDLDALADVYWRRILRTFFILLFLGTIGAVALFTHISNVFDSSFGEDENINSLILNKESLEEALSFSLEKQKNLEMAKQNLPDTIDPSSTNSYSLEQ